MQSFSSMLAENLAPKQITSLAIGKFDGIHLGHRKLLELLGDRGAVLIIDKAVEQNLISQSPSVQTQGFLTSLQDRLDHLPNAYFVEFASVAHMSGEEFVSTLLESLPSLETIIVGYDFRFGRDRLCGADDLRHLCEIRQSSQERAIQAIIVPKVCYGEIPLHASVIKDFVRHGDIAVANAMLGWHYTITGDVIRGQGIASKELFPTINIRAQGYVLPASGVYATRVNGKMAVSFFGHRVSTDGAYAIESHIIDSEIVQVPERLTIQMYKKIRENRRFDSLQELKAQIECDIKQVREIWEWEL
ncbi:bifunctional riboflavin kinase/FAD synthetase [Helicobacter canis]|uniref:Riboflavin biosynthesis protein n=1 Tax=Helicobacter canis NCTC 12740 TaxID=1357399 RepID=V8CGP6_9HELI|nr:bifunctional riboflavin kinase/FAD synthetase [Helicobacter canis]ETD25921.1 riboflavin biosynthesis protein RibF [Helicobacter canis NCTC 12740]